MIAAAFQVIAFAAAIGALLWVRFAFVSLNADLRELLRRQTGLATMFATYTASMDELEKRIKALEDA